MQFALHIRKPDSRHGLPGLNRPGEPSKAGLSKAFLGNTAIGMLYIDKYNTDI